MLHQMLLLLAVSSVALAAVARQALEDKPEEYKDCDGCWLSEFQVFLQPDEKYPSPTKCEEYQCKPTEVLIVSCGAVAAVPPCEVVSGNESEDYPACCKTIYCPPKNE